MLCIKWRPILLKHTHIRKRCATPARIFTDQNVGRNFGNRFDDVELDETIFIDTVWNDLGDAIVFAQPNCQQSVVSGMLEKRS